MAEFGALTRIGEGRRYVAHAHERIVFAVHHPFFVEAGSHIKLCALLGNADAVARVVETEDRALEFLRGSAHAVGAAHIYDLFSRGQRDGRVATIRLSLRDWDDAAATDKTATKYTGDDPIRPARVRAWKEMSARVPRPYATQFVRRGATTVRGEAFEERWLGPQDVDGYHGLVRIEATPAVTMAEHYACVTWTARVVSWGDDAPAASGGGGGGGGVSGPLPVPTPVPTAPPAHDWSKSTADASTHTTHDEHGDPC